ncbi:MAG TPA: hypothetical protein V6D08_17605, partial [Candidatus Obscuribacterales bacterium]
IPLPAPPAVGQPPAPSAPGATDAASALATIWKANYEVASNAREILNQGKNWLPRKDWLNYYAGNINQHLIILEQELTSKALPDNQQAVISDEWSQMQSLAADMKIRFDDLTAEIGALPDQTAEAQQDLSKVPPESLKFHAPAQTIADDADKLDKLLIQVYAKIGSQLSPPPSPANRATAQQGPASDGAEMASGQASSGSDTSGTTLKGRAQVLAADTATRMIGDAAKKIRDSATSLLNELERWNLLWGQPPAGGPANIMYGGGLTPSEVLTQYYYLPSFAFTAPGYLRFSYRLPPRQKYLVIYTTQIGKMINLMASEIDDASFPPDKQAAVAGPWSEVQDIFKDLISNYMDLLKLVNASNDDRLKKNIREDQITFGKPVVAIYSDMDKLNRVLADVNTIIKQ